MYENFPNLHYQTIDWTFWEQKYGRPLSEIEKIEIEVNLRVLIQVVKEVNADTAEPSSPQLLRRLNAHL